MSSNPFLAAGPILHTIQVVGISVGGLALAGAILWLHFGAVDPGAKQKAVAMITTVLAAMVFLTFLPDLFKFWTVLSGHRIAGGAGAAASVPPPWTPSKPASAGGGILGIIASMISWIINGVLGGVIWLLFHILQILLDHTLLAPISLWRGAYAATVRHIYGITAPVGLLILAISAAYGLAKGAAGGILNATPPAAIVGRSIGAAVAVAAGYPLIASLVSINNIFVRYFQGLGYHHSFLAFLEDPTRILTSLGAGAELALAGALLGDLLVLLAIVFLFWIAVTLIVRLFELAMLTAAFPIMVSFTTLQETTNLWATYVGELLAAVFLQGVQVFFLWLAGALLFGRGDYDLTFFLSLVSLYFIARAPAVLRQFLRHGVAGGSIATEAAMGYVGARALMPALRHTPGGRLLHALTEGQQSATDHIVAGEVDAPNLGRAFPATAAVAGAAGGVAGAVAGGLGLARRDDGQRQGVVKTARLWGPLSMAKVSDAAGRGLASVYRGVRGYEEEPAGIVSTGVAGEAMDGTVGVADPLDIDELARSSDIPNMTQEEVADVYRQVQRDHEIYRLYHGGLPERNPIPGGLPEGNPLHGGLPEGDPLPGMYPRGNPLPGRYPKGNPIYRRW